MNNNDLQQKYDSLVREYCTLMDENRKLKGSYNTHFKGKGLFNYE